MLKRKKTLLLKAIVICIVSLVIAILAHSYYIVQYPSGKVMKGINDGLSQMLPFKHFLYENYSIGNFFYSDSFGIGGGIFSQLAYYYSTNIYYLIVVCVLFFAELLFNFDVGFNTWISLVLPMSIVKMSLIILISYHYFKVMNLSKKSAYLGAIVYAVSPFYLRHEMYWDFFSDALFWIMFLLIGIEKVIRKQSPMLFTLAVAFTVINNFYFAYINLLLAFFYILFRWIIRISEPELGYWKQLKLFIFGGLLGFGIGSFAFIPAVISFLENFRPKYNDNIPLIEFADNILLNSRIIWLPIIVVIVLCMRNLYRDKLFRLFALLAIVGTIFHFVPYIGSLFNGFSAPQNRWESIVILGYAGVVAFGLDHLKDWKVNQIIFGSSVFFVLAIVSLVVDRTLTFENWLHYPLPILSFILVITFIGLIKFKKIDYTTIGIVTILFVIVYSNIYQANRLSQVAKESQSPTITFMNSDLYNSEEQRLLISEAKLHLVEGARIDWMVKLRNNTPIVQDFDGVSVYSSILNQHIIKMYLKELQIDMGRESVSRYASLGSRTNLMSLLQVQFFMRDRKQLSVPYLYEPFAQTKNYIMYKNDNLLPRFRVVNQFLTEKSLDSEPVIQREHAMLKGVIVANQSFEETLQLDEINSKIPDKIHLVNAKMEKDYLVVERKKGGVDLFVTTSSDRVQDFYVAFTLERVDKSEGFSLTVNEYRTTRKASTSVYRTNVNDLTIRVKAADLISIRLPKGTYRLENVKIYEEDYTTLNDALMQSIEADIHWENGKASGNVLTSSDHEMVVTPIPFEPGWELKINGKKAKIEKVNYSFIGIPLVEGVNNIELNYLPPFFKPCLIISLLSIITLIMYSLRNKKRLK